MTHDKNLVTILEAKAVTSSLQVAQKFDKRHSDVIRSIENIIPQLPKNECERIFAFTYNQVKQPNGGYRNESYYLMNRDGFTLLAMGFTGKKALQFKLDYINAFNQMEEYIKNQSVQNPLFDLNKEWINWKNELEKKVIEIEGLKKLSKVLENNYNDIIACHNQFKQLTFDILRNSNQTINKERTLRRKAENKLKQIKQLA